MTATSSSDAELVDTLGVLRAVMRDERRAIARLDVAAVESLTARKHTIVARLERLGGICPGPAVAPLLTQARLELAANATLLATARDGVAALLGRNPDGQYDRRARAYSTTRPLRTITL